MPPPQKRPQPRPARGSAQPIAGRPSAGTLAGAARTAAETVPPTHAAPGTTPSGETPGSGNGGASDTGTPRDSTSMLPPVRLTVGDVEVDVTYNGPVGDPNYPEPTTDQWAAFVTAVLDGALALQEPAPPPSE